MTLPNRATAYGLPAYTQSNATYHPTENTSNGVKWLSSPYTEERWMTTASNYDLRETDVFAVVKRLDNRNLGYMMGDGTGNKRVGFFSDQIRFTNFYGGTLTGTTSITGATHGWFVVHMRFRVGGNTSFFRAWSRAGALIDELTTTFDPNDPTPTAQPQDMLLGSYLNSGTPHEASDMGLSRILVYSHALGGFPDDAVTGDVLTALRAEATTLQGA